MKTEAGAVGQPGITKESVIGFLVLLTVEQHLHHQEQLLGSHGKWGGGAEENLIHMSYDAPRILQQDLL